MESDFDKNDDIWIWHRNAIVQLKTGLKVAFKIQVINRMVPEIHPTIPIIDHASQIDMR